MYSKMLVPIDASAPSKLALGEAIQLAQSLQASLRLLHVIEVWSLLTPETTGANYDTLLDMMRRGGAQLLQDAAAIVSRAGINVQTNLVEAPDVQVGEIIVRKAREYETTLIICGTHGRRGVRRLLMGSDAEYVVRHSPVPVLLVRTQGVASEEAPVAVGAAA